MLEELRIRGLGVIAEATLELSPGLTVLTGETGAGKTMVLQGLALVTGGRADSALLRQGADRASVDARFRLLGGPGETAADRLAAAGGVLDDAGPDGSREMIIARSVSAEGRSRAVAGGVSVPAGVLGELTGELVSVHGQHAQRRLLSTEQQRAAVDRYGGPVLDGLVAGYRAIWTQLVDARRELAAVTSAARDRAQESELLRAGLDRIVAVEPQAGEEDALTTEIERLAHAESLRTAAEHAHAALAGDTRLEAGDVQTVLGEIRHALAAVSAHDPVLAALEARVAELGYLTADVAGDLAGYAASVEADPLRLEAAQQRLARLATLVRAWGPRTDDVLAWAATAASRLTALEHDDERLSFLGSRVEELRDDLRRASTELGAARRKAAARLGAAVSEELHGLAMPHATLAVAFTPLPEPGPWGSEEIELQLAANPGATPRAISKAASGGELSRVMLAIEVVLAHSQEPGLLVFDEVDAGVGGRAAVEVGRRLARLALGRQVLVVTHLPQVAAFADRHLVVLKSDDGSVVESGVRSLDHDGRVAELSRMLAGLDDSVSARAHAEELLGFAAEERSRAEHSLTPS